MYFFCTITSKEYLFHTLALIEKLDKEKIFILCLDNYSHNFFNSNILNSKITIILINNLESQNNLEKIKNNRNNLEFIFTIKAIFIHFILKTLSKHSLLVYLDSDIYFFNKIKFLKKELKNYSIFISEHNFSNLNFDKKKFGNFNAGFIAFKKDDNGLRAVEWWEKKCIQSCSMSVTKNRFADQKYLNFLSKKFNRIKIIKNPGINLAPWNISNYEIQIKKNVIYVDKKPLIFFHFHGYKMILNILFLKGLSNYFVKDSYEINFIYYLYSKKVSYYKKKYFIPYLNFLKIIKLTIKGVIEKDLILTY